MRPAAAATLTALLTLPMVAQAGSSEPRRSAVIVGANAAAPGRKPLRFAHNDAINLARVLIDVANFKETDVHVLYDPSPQEVLDRLDTTLAELDDPSQEALLVFYYSGHADHQSMYPRGQPLRFSELRTRLDDERAAVRLGILDTCRGGGWTGARGLSEAEVFEVNVPISLSNEGSVFIASSSGLEDAHETPDFSGGFFTITGTPPSAGAEMKTRTASSRWPKPSPTRSG